MPTRKGTREELVASFHRTKKRLLMFDFDGTLTPIVTDPPKALPSPAILKALQKLIKDERNVVFVISGRDMDFLVANLGQHLPGLGLSAEHGCFIRLPWSDKKIDFVPWDLPWVAVAKQIFDTTLNATRHYYLPEVPDSSIVEKKAKGWAFHIRQVKEGRLGMEQHMQTAKRCLQVEKMKYAALDRDFSIGDGKKSIDCHPSVTKGDIVQAILFRYPEADFTLCAGDDTTDLNMFKAIHARDEQRKVIPAVFSNIQRKDPTGKHKWFDGLETDLELHQRVQELTKHNGYEHLEEDLMSGAKPLDILMAQPSVLEENNVWNIGVEPETKKFKDATLRMDRPRDVVALLVELSEVEVKPGEYNTLEPKHMTADHIQTILRSRGSVAREEGKGFRRRRESVSSGRNGRF